MVPRSLWTLDTLKVLSLRNTGLEELPAAVSNLTNLQELNVGNNRLHWLPFELLQLLGPGKPLTRLFITPNPFIETLTMPHVCPEEPTPETKKSDLNDGSTKSPPALLLDALERKKTCFANSRPDSSDSQVFADGYHKFHVASTKADKIPLRGQDWIHDYSHNRVFVSVKGQGDSLSVSKAIQPPSLLYMSVQRALETTDVVDILGLLPEDCPPPIPQAIADGKQAWNEGGRSCTVCGRSYATVRAQWVEFWQIEPSGSNPVSCSDLAWPFLRRVCSDSCIPESS